MHCNCCELGLVGGGKTEEESLEWEGGSQRRVGGTGVAAGAGVSGGGKGLGRHMGSPLVLDDALGPGKEDRVHGSFWRSAGLISNHDYPGGGKKGLSSPDLCYAHSHRYSGFGELLRPNKTRERESWKKLHISSMAGLTLGGLSFSVL